MVQHQDVAFILAQTCFPSPYRLSRYASLHIRDAGVTSYCSWSIGMLESFDPYSYSRLNRCEDIIEQDPPSTVGCGMYLELGWGPGYGPRPYMPCSSPRTHRCPRLPLLQRIVDRMVTKWKTETTGDTSDGTQSVRTAPHRDDVSYGCLQRLFVIAQARWIIIRGKLGTPRYRTHHDIQAPGTIVVAMKTTAANIAF